MCNSVLGVKRRLLALLLIVGCMAVSAPAFARVCFLPDSKDCGLGAPEGETCDGVNTFAKYKDCIRYTVDGQDCTQNTEGGCYHVACEYASQEACETYAKDHCTKNNFISCELDSSTGCYIATDTTCVDKTESDCKNYNLDAPKDGMTCGSCTRHTTTYTCKDSCTVEQSETTTTVYDCKETKYREVGCDDFKTTEADANKLIAQNYTCTPCTKELQKQTYEGDWDKYGTGETVYKCDKCTPTNTCSDYTYTTLSDTKNATSCDDGCGKTQWKCNTGYSYDSATRSCKAKDPNDGKTYYVILDREVTATTNGDDTDCKFTVDGKIKYPDVSGDTLMNNVYFGAQIAGYIDYKEEGSGGEDYYPNKAYTIPVQNLMSNANNYTRTADYGAYAETGSPLPCLYEGNYSAYSALNASNFWVGFEQGQSLYVDANKLASDYSTRCKTITIDGSSRTICVKYSDDLQSCSDYGLQNQSSANCGYGTTFVQDTVHKTDDYNNICGTCQKNVTFSVNTLDCGGSVSSCEYFYPCTSDVGTGLQCYKCIISLYKNLYVIWIDSEGKIQYVKKDTFSSVPYSDEYVVLTTMNDYSDVTDDLGTMEGWQPSSKFDNTVGIRRGFYELYIEQKHSDKTSQCYLSTDESLSTWKLGNPDKSACEKEISGHTSSDSDYTFGAGAGGTTVLSYSDIKKMFPNKTINDNTTYIDISGLAGDNKTALISKYIWYRVTNTKPSDEINIYPRCYRDVNLNKGFGGRCYFGWKGTDSSLGNYTNCKKLN